MAGKGGTTWKKCVLGAEGGSRGNGKQVMH